MAIRSELPGQRTPSPDLVRRYRSQGFWSDRSLWDHLVAAVDRDRDRTAVIDRDGHHSYGALRTDAERVADGLRRAGVREGDRFVLQLPNRYEAVVLHLALTRLGALTVSVPVTYRFAELQSIVSITRSAGMAVPGEGRHGELTDLIPRLRALAPSLSVTVAVGGDARPGVSSYSEIRAAGAEEGASTVPAVHDPQAVTWLAYTSGTTGEPKGVMHTSATLGAMNETFVRAYGLSSDDRILMAAPVGHSIGFIHGIRLSVFLGCTLVLTEAWDPIEVHRLALEHEATFTVFAVPHLHDVVRTWPDAPPRLRVVLCGGSPVPPGLMRRARERFPSVWTSPLWGMTEGIGTGCLVGAPEEKLFTTDGRPFPGTELRILSPDGGALGPGEHGQLAMRGPQLFAGYYLRPDLDTECFLPDGFFLTGDLATMDGDGYVRIVGRLKDLVIRGGVNIAPAPLERVLADDPRIEQVAVVGWPDERLGERICAVVVPRAGEVIELEDLIDRVRAAGFAKHSWPERMVLASSLPATPSGKIQKGQLRSIVAGLPPDALVIRGDEEPPLHG